MFQRGFLGSLYKDLVTMLQHGIAFTGSKNERDVAKFMYDKALQEDSDLFYKISTQMQDERTIFYKDIIENDMEWPQDKDELDCKDGFFENLTD